MKKSASISMIAGLATSSGIEVWKEHRLLVWKHQTLLHAFSAQRGEMRAILSENVERLGGKDFRSNRIEGR
jgi:hypothetical protein